MSKEMLYEMFFKSLFILVALITLTSAQMYVQQRNPLERNFQEVNRRQSPMDKENPIVYIEPTKDNRRLVPVPNHGNARDLAGFRAVSDGAMRNDRERFYDQRSGERTIQYHNDNRDYQQFNGDINSKVRQNEPPREYNNNRNFQPRNQFEQKSTNLQPPDRINSAKNKVSQQSMSNTNLNKDCYQDKINDSEPNTQVILNEDSRQEKQVPVNDAKIYFENDENQKVIKYQEESPTASNLSNNITSTYNSIPINSTNIMKIPAKEDNPIIESTDMTTSTTVSIDQRSSFNGGGCAYGKVKINSICVDIED